VVVVIGSYLVFRDLDLLHRIEESVILLDDLNVKEIRSVIIISSFCAFDETIAHQFEPNADSRMKRMEMLKQLQK